MKNETMNHVKNIIMSDTQTVKRLNFWSGEVFEIVTHNFKSGAYYEIVDNEKETVVSNMHAQTDAQHYLNITAIPLNTPVRGYGFNSGKIFQDLPEDLQATICKMATV